MPRFSYSSLHQSLTHERDWPSVPVHVTPRNVIECLIEGHLLLTGLLYQRGRLNSQQIGMFQDLSHGCFDNYLKPDGSMYTELDDVERSQLKTYLGLFLEYWFSVLAPVYEGVTQGLDYNAGAPEVVFFRPFGKQLANGERFSIQLPTTVSWEFEEMAPQVSDGDVLLEIHTAANYPMLIRSSPRYMMKPPRVPEVSDQERFGVVIAPSDFRVMRTRSAQWQDQELTVLVVRPIPANSSGTFQ